MELESFVPTDPAEAAEVNPLQLRLIAPGEKARWDQLVCEQHYLHSARLVGEQLRYVAEDHGCWRALLGWSAAAYHLKDRDAHIGWDLNQLRARLHLLANNARLCLLGPPGQSPNLASRLLASNCARLSADWQAVYGHPLLLVETFVQESSFPGTVYQAAGWQRVGATAGFTRVAEGFYAAHERPKALYVRPLVEHAERTLRARRLPAPLQIHERALVRQCLLPAEELTRLWMVLNQRVPERRRTGGPHHRQATVLTILWAFVLAGAQGGPRALARFAQGLTQRQRAAARCHYNVRARGFDVPPEKCFSRVLTSVPAADFQAALRAWQTTRAQGDDGAAAPAAALGDGGPGAPPVPSGPDPDRASSAAPTLLDWLASEDAIALLDALDADRPAL